MATAPNLHLAKMSDEDFMEMFERLGAAEMSRQTDYAQRAIHTRRRRLEKQYGIVLTPPGKGQSVEVERTARREHYTDNGSVLIFSDAHYWPQLIPTIHYAICEVAEEIQPELIIANGDIFDGASMSRHAKINWEETPSPVDEIYACQARLAEIENAAPKARKIWTLGNHDARFESYVANHAPEMAKVTGVHLRDHFPNWETAWSCWINDDIVIKHRWHGGIHAAYNNVLKAGKTFVTGHTHQLNIRPHNDYNGLRYGIECGTCSEPNGPQYLAYTEDNPKNWSSAAVVLTIKDGVLLPPEPILRIDKGKYAFRGELRDVGRNKRADKKSPKRARTARKRNG